MDVKRGQKKRGDESRGGGGERGEEWSGVVKRGEERRGEGRGKGDSPSISLLLSHVVIVVLVVFSLFFSHFRI